MATKRVEIQDKYSYNLKKLYQYIIYVKVVNTSNATSTASKTYPLITYVDCSKLQSCLMSRK
jgi:hypothetical protein